MNTEAWRDHAACAGTDPDLFFPDQGASGPAVVAAAKAICRTCPVRPACLEYALTNGEKFGIYGGTSERERRNMRAERNRAKAALTLHTGGAQ